MTSDSPSRLSESVAFSAPLEAWRLIADQWYGGRSAPFDMEIHKAAEKVMADVDRAVTSLEP